MINHPKTVAIAALPKNFNPRLLTCIVARDKFAKAGVRGAFGSPKKREKKAPYVPGLGCGKAIPTNRAVMFRGRRPGDEHRMVIYSDGSLRHESTKGQP